MDPLFYYIPHFLNLAILELALHACLCLLSSVIKGMSQILYKLTHPSGMTDHSAPLEGLSL